VGINSGRLNAYPQTPSTFSFFVPGQKRRSSLAPTDSPAVMSPPAKADAPISRSTPLETNRSQAKAARELGKIDVNTATEKELRSVPGIGVVIGARIISARPFRSADDLKKVNGIGEKNYAKIRPYFQ